MPTRKSTVAVTVEAVMDQKPPSVVFSKNKVLTLNRYAGRRDLLAVLLKDGKTYTLEQVDGLIQEFMTKGKVN